MMASNPLNLAIRFFLEIAALAGIGTRWSGALLGALVDIGNLV